MNTQSNTPSRFTLTSVSDIYAMPFGDAMKAALARKFQRIQEMTPSKISLGDLRSALRTTSYTYQDMDQAVMLSQGDVRGGMGIMMAAMGMGKGDEVAGMYLVQRGSCIGRYVEVQWTIVIANGSATFEPGLNGETIVGEVDFRFLRYVDSDLRKTDANLSDHISILEDHPELLYALSEEVEMVMKDRIEALASEFGLDDMLLPDGTKPVELDKVAVSTDTMRELIALTGYQAPDQMDERKLLNLVIATIDAEEE
jgi:hypothetical protein